MIISSSSSLADVAFAVCTALGYLKIDCVLSGGSAATIWSNAAYQSHDCDFVIQFHPKEAPAKQTLEAMGYIHTGRIFQHHSNPFTLDFPSGPLAIGSEIIESWDTLQRDDYYLNIINPTDSCRDRLASYYFWNDFSSLEAAIAVAKINLLNYDVIQNWSESENNLDKYQEFRRRLNNS